jgi:hypothetical protein
MTGAHFRDYHLLLDEQAEQVFAVTTPSLSVSASAELRSSPNRKSLAAPGR